MYPAILMNIMNVKVISSYGSTCTEIHIQMCEDKSYFKDFLFKCIAGKS